MKLIERPEPDPLWQGPVVAHESRCRWIAIPMLFNHRLVCVPDGERYGAAEYGWCYRSLAALIASAAVFEPDTQDEPLGWHKRAGGGLRRAPNRCQDPEHNRPRCVHGSYIDAGLCEHTSVCPDMGTHPPRMHPS
ncbi:hypothetical protein ACF06P_35545 [Streptomyces sp. NPDC015684]|uniref:hypothetical protein n=1 Tax=Streptomyces sp. NPDC015684 TaxID=3364963 RepID=UPI003701FF1F